MVKEMELTLENLIDEIIKQESQYRSLMIEAEEMYGETYELTKFFRSKWSVFYNLASKFDFVDKLER